VQAAVQDTLPDRIEVVTGEQIADETKDQVGEIVSIFGTGLLVFALITALVAAFVINNIYNISISQRLRELACCEPSVPTAGRSAAWCSSRR
jgi:putative ABC transport system permease protein